MPCRSVHRTACDSPVLVVAHADDLAPIVDRDGEAGRPAGEGAEVGHLAVLPHERMRDRLAVLVFASMAAFPTIWPRSLIADAHRRPAERAEVGHLPVLPQERVPVTCLIAVPSPADDLAALVDRDRRIVARPGSVPKSGSVPFSHTNAGPLDLPTI